MIRNISKLLKYSINPIPRNPLSSLATQAADAKQLQELAMEENCILVDEKDKNLGSVSKRDCHQVLPGGEIRLHRAFSVFLFNKKGEMLLQRRTPQKITFPDCYTNACCSHPLHDIIGEQEEYNQMGIRRAAQRRINFELGIPFEQVKPEDFQYLTRIHYKDVGDGIWGEHEIDYILFMQNEFDLNPNPNEVSEVRYIPRKHIDNIPNMGAPLTPWFHLILQHRLKLWWDNLQQLENFSNHDTIECFQQLK